MISSLPPVISIVHKINHKIFRFHGLSNIKIMLNKYSNITFPKVNYRVFSKKRHSCSVFFIVFF
ncbi:hypothetical protein COJ28_30290 [Bacillus thuringiensis]|nr:hypothetical protein COJ28_30290 [Bacillus thuringiensis]